MEAESANKRDWVGNTRSFALAWVIPSAAMVGTIFTPTPIRTVVWIGALIWMGAACLANASRCGRMHCYFTGPFFLLMALVTGLHGLKVVNLGAEGWVWLGTMTAAGGFGLWWMPEYLWGKFTARPEK